MSLSRRTPLALPAAATIALVALVACSDGGKGDDQPHVQGSLRGNGHTLAELNDRMRSPSPPSPTQILSVTGTRVTWIDTYDETGTGQAGDIFVQDVFPPDAVFGRGNEGMLIFQPAYSPPSFRPSVNDVLDLSGLYQEFQVPKQSYLDKTWRTPEMSGATLSLRVDAATGTSVTPADAQLTDFFAYDSGRRWLSMLVTLHDVVAQGSPVASKGRLNINLTTVDNQVVPPPMQVPGADPPLVLSQPSISNELVDLSGVIVQPGQAIKSVTGIVTLFNGFHVAPRSLDDIVL